MSQNPAKRKSPSYGPESVSSLGETQVELDSFSILWTIKNFADASQLEKLESPVFYGGPKSNHAWQIEMVPKKKYSNTDTEYVSLSLTFKEYGDGKGNRCDGVKAIVQFSILNSDGQPSSQNGDTWNKHVAEFEKESKPTWGWPIIIPHRDFFWSYSPNFLVDNTLKVHCEIKIIGDLKQKLSNGGKANSGPSREERNKRFKDELSNDFGKLFKEEIGTDLTIVVGTTGLKAHKAVLTARSSVFAAMFNSNMIENESSTVEISDFDEAVVKGMLEHLYTGQTECMTERSAELMEIAEKYNLTGLKEDCEYELGDNLTNENVAVVFVLAHTLNAPHLKERTTDFIKRNKAQLWAAPAFRDVVKAQPDQTIFSDIFLL